MYVTSTVVPMGWTNAMPLIQYLHRRLLVSPRPVGRLGPAALHDVDEGLPLDRELRKDRVVPKLSADANSAWQVYCDDFDSCSLVDAARDGSHYSRVVGRGHTRVRGSFQCDGLLCRGEHS